MLLPQQKQDREKQVFERFVEISGRTICFSRFGNPNQSEPDIIAEENGALRCFEVTQANLDARLGRHTLRQVEAHRSRLVGRLQTMWEDQGGETANVWFWSKPARGPHELQIQFEPEAKLFEAVQKAHRLATKLPLGHYAEVEQCWGRVQFACSRRTIWRMLNDHEGWVNEDGEPIRAAYTRKSRKAYRTQERECVELIIYCEPSWRSGLIECPDDFVLPEYTFARVYFLSLPQTLIELKQLP